MKKQIRMLSDIAAVLAVTLMLTVALLPAGLSGAEGLDSETTEEAGASDGTADNVIASPALQIISGAAAHSKPAAHVSSKIEAAKGTESETQDDEAVPEETTTAQTTTTTPPQTTAKTTAQTTAAPQSAWTEQETSGVMYVNTDGIYSREVAVVGSARIRQYALNEAVTVIAVTDTSYYKLEDGTFIHTDYLSSSETVITTVSETSAAAADTTAAETEAENENEDEDSATAETVDVVVDDVVPLSAQPDVQSMALEMFELVNEYRAQYGLSALQWDYNSYPAAQIRAGELLQHNSHTRPNGESYSTVYNDVGYYPSSKGENIVYYYSNARSAFNSLVNSASHRALILSTKFTHISIAYTYDPSSYWGYYWVQEFTTP